MLPRSSASVFTHVDIAPQNIIVDESNRITGIVDWECAG
jgi:aminoglycoside phosphotransferase (APT) family kinase protein